MTYDQAVIQLRSQVKQLAAAAASQCLRDRLDRSSIAYPLVELDRLAREIAAPALDALAVIAGEPQDWPDVPADEIQVKADKARHSAR